MRDSGVQRKLRNVTYIRDYTSTLHIYIDVGAIVDIKSWAPVLVFRSLFNSLRESPHQISFTSGLSFFLHFFVGIPHRGQALWRVRTECTFTRLTRQNGVNPDKHHRLAIKVIRNYKEKGPRIRSDSREGDDSDRGFVPTRRSFCDFLNLPPRTITRASAGISNWSLPQATDSIFEAICSIIKLLRLMQSFIMYSISIRMLFTVL